MKKNIFLFLMFILVTLSLLYVKIGYQNYIGSRFSSFILTDVLEMYSLIFLKKRMTFHEINFFETGDIFIILISFFFLTKVISEIFLKNFKNTKKNKNILMLFTIIYFFIIEISRSVDFYYSYMRILRFFGEKISIENIMKRAFFSLINPINLSILAAVILILFLKTRKAEK